MRNPALRVRHMYPLQTKYNRQPLCLKHLLLAPCKRLSRSQTTMSWSDFRGAFVGLVFYLASLPISFGSTFGSHKFLS